MQYHGKSDSRCSTQASELESRDGGGNGGFGAADNDRAGSVSRRAVLRSAAAAAIASLAAPAAFGARRTGADSSRTGSRGEDAGRRTSRRSGASRAAAGRAGASLDIDFATAAQAAEAISRGSVSSRELTQRMLERIEKYNPSLNAVVNVLSDQALADALRADEAQARRQPLGPLHGVPIVVKDQFEIAGVPTTAGVEQLANYRPTTDSEVVRRLRAAGAIVLGNTNVPLLLSDWQSYNALYGTTNNPWDLARTPGGSSGGSAAALAAGLAYFSPGSDRAGSLRLPADFCGIYGHKPSLDVVPLRGWMPSPPGGPPQLPETVTVAGPLARSAADLALGMGVMGGPDGAKAEAYRWSMPAPRQRRLQDYRVGFVIDDPACPVDAPVKACLEKTVTALEQAGVTLREGWPKGVDPRAQHRTFYYLMSASLGLLPPGVTEEQLRPLAAKDDGSFGSLFAQSYLDPHRRFLDHERERFAARRVWQAAFEEVDVFLMPACFVAAFAHDHTEPQAFRKIATSAGPRPYLDLIFWSSFASLAGLPSTAAPIGFTDGGLPVGMQIVGPYLEDATPIDFAARLSDEIGGFMQPTAFG